MSDTVQDSPDLGWRKRHPILSRTLLYAVGVGVAAVLLQLYLERQAVDAQDRADAVAQELDATTVLHAIDADGSLVLKYLDEKFMDPGLPLKVRGRALRWRALALRKQGDPVPVEAALEAADALALEPVERLALHLEWAEARLGARDAAGALAILPAQAAVANSAPLLLLRALLYAQAEEQAGRAEGGQADLGSALAGLRAPLDADVRVYVGGRDWTGAQVATVATEFLVALKAVPALKAWRRLQRLAPQDFDSQVACTRGFLGLGEDADAHAAWDRARRLDPRLATIEAQHDPALAALER